MRRILRTIQKKPPHVRQFVAVAITTVATGLIAAAWILTLSIQFNPKAVAERGKSQNPFTLLGNSIKSAYKNAQDRFSGDSSSASAIDATVPEEEKVTSVTLTPEGDQNFSTESTQN